MIALHHLAMVATASEQNPQKVGGTFRMIALHHLAMVATASAQNPKRWVARFE
jgi:hypothetical protein